MRDRPERIPIASRSLPNRETALARVYGAILVDSPLQIADFRSMVNKTLQRSGVLNFGISVFRVALLGAVLAGAGCAIDRSTPDDDLVATTREPLVLMTGQGWGRDANGVTTTLRVCWDTSTTLSWNPDFPMLQATVERAVNTTWARNSRVSFTGWQFCSGGEQVTIVVTDNGSHTEPFIGLHKFTYLDFAQCGPDPTAKANCVYDTAVHEFGHVLGFVHEQTRIDTPSSCMQREASDGLITLAGGTYYGSWDLDSVMNYCNPVTDNDGRLSSTDQFGLQSVYGTPAGPSACQRASDRYGISANVTWGFAPLDVQVWWTSNHCMTAPASGDTCQRAADTYGISAGGPWGFAPADVQTWWTENGCSAHAVGPNACQRASDLFAIQPLVLWNFTPTEVQTWWVQNDCNNAHVQPAQTSACQRISDLYGVDAFVTFGFAPSDVQAFWIANNCNTHPGLRPVRSVSP